VLGYAMDDTWYKANSDSARQVRQIVADITAENVVSEPFTSATGLTFTPSPFTILAIARTRYLGYTEVVQLRGLGGYHSPNRAGIVAFCKSGEQTPTWASILRANGSLTSDFLSLRSDDFSVS
jgi:hypothetical protein